MLVAGLTFQLLYLMFNRKMAAESPETFHWPTNDSRTTVWEHLLYTHCCSLVTVKRDVNARSALRLKDEKWLTCVASNGFLKTLNMSLMKYGATWTSAAISSLKCSVQQGPAGQQSVPIYLTSSMLQTRYLAQKLLVRLWVVMRLFSW